MTLRLQNSADDMGERGVPILFRDVTTDRLDDIPGAGDHGRCQMFDSREMLYQSWRNQFPGFFPENFVAVGFRRNGTSRTKSKRRENAGSRVLIEFEIQNTLRIQSAMSRSRRE